jgi:hypothetical protein
VGQTCQVRLGSCDAVTGTIEQTDQVACGCQLDDIPSSCITCGEGALGTCGGDCAYEVGTNNREARGTCMPSSAGSDTCACYAIGSGQQLDVAGCGGVLGASCPGQRCCADDPRDGCSPADGGACPGVCVASDDCSVGTTGFAAAVLGAAR